MEYNWYVIRKSYDKHGEVALLDKEKAKKFGYVFDVKTTYDPFQPRKSIYTEEHAEYDLDVVGFSTKEYAQQFIDNVLFEYEEMKTLESLIDKKTYKLAE